MIGNYVTFGSYPQTQEGDDKTPIEWLVLDRDGEKALLISKYVLDASYYNQLNNDVTWETCQLRTWLNNDFLNIAFTEEEQMGILTNKVDNSWRQINNHYKTDGGNDTEDKVFLLSYAEAVKYLNAGGWRDDRNLKARAAPTEYAKQQHPLRNASVRAKTEEGYVAVDWWLRSPGYKQKEAECVLGSGEIDSNEVRYGRRGIRPAIWLNLNSGVL